MFIKYDGSDYEKLNIGIQHNIMVLVGNGFDIAVMSNFHNGILSGKLPTYDEFYDYVKYFGLSGGRNKIIAEMGSRRGLGQKNWSDFELCIDEMIRTEQFDMAGLANDLVEIQGAFSRFLNDIVTADTLVELSKFAAKNKLSTRSLSMFLGDIDDEADFEIKFPRKTDHYHLYNFLFVNFNYTALLDNYIHLDSSQFDPHRHSGVDTNFSFYPNPNGYFPEPSQDRVWSTYLLTSIIHPHGYQDICTAPLHLYVKSDQKFTLSRF